MRNKKLLGALLAVTTLATFGFARLRRLWLQRRRLQGG